MGARDKSKAVVYAALIGNVLVAAAKFIAALWTGSSAMLSEAVHSVVDTSNQGVLLYGIHRSAKPPDDAHPLGYGRELYFWSFIVALLMFTVGAGVTFYEGVQHILRPEPIQNLVVNYVVIAFALLFEGATWLFARREFRRTQGDLNLFTAATQSKDPPAFIVLFEDSAAVIGLLIALAGITASYYLAAPVIDGAASIAISLLLAGVALLLAHESKGLLMGEPANRRTREAIATCAREIPGIVNAQVLFTVHLSPDQIVAALNVEFADGLTTPEIEEKVDRLEKALHNGMPELIALFIKPRPVKGSQTDRPAAAPMRRTG